MTGFFAVLALIAFALWGLERLDRLRAESRGRHPSTGARLPDPPSHVRRVPPLEEGVE